jgi:dephospho-CoA kinase
VLSVGLTGGIGSGKSTVAEALVARGAVLVDADRIARQVVEPGQPAHRRLVERFGARIVAPDGTIDRPALADIAFADRAALADLNSITHPAIAAEMERQRAAYRHSDAVVLLDIPLMTPAQRDLLGLDLVVVVDCDPEVALERLVSQRGMDRRQARARMAAQPSREQRLAGADLVVDNGGDRSRLAEEVERLWGELAARAARKAQGQA